MKTFILAFLLLYSSIMNSQIFSYKLLKQLSNTECENFEQSLYNSHRFLKMGNLKESCGETFKQEYIGGKDLYDRVMILISKESEQRKPNFRFSVGYGIDLATFKKELLADGYHYIGENSEGSAVMMEYESAQAKIAMSKYGNSYGIRQVIYYIK